MNKIILLFSTLFLFSCAGYNPVADLRASKDANSFQEDRQHCKFHNPFL